LIHRHCKRETKSSGKSPKAIEPEFPGLTLSNKPSGVITQQPMAPTGDQILPRRLAELKKAEVTQRELQFVQRPDSRMD
jgi:hypothetical protein